MINISNEGDHKDYVFDVKKTLDGKTKDAQLSNEAIAKAQIRGGPIERFFIGYENDHIVEILEPNFIVQNIGSCHALLKKHEHRKLREQVKETIVTLHTIPDMFEKLPLISQLYTLKVFSKHLKNIENQLDEITDISSTKPLNADFKTLLKIVLALQNTVDDMPINEVLKKVADSSFKKREKHICKTSEYCDEIINAAQLIKTYVKNVMVCCVVLDYYTITSKHADQLIEMIKFVEKCEESEKS